MRYLSGSSWGSSCRFAVLAASLVLVVVAGQVWAQALPAFPGAEGFGANATGGRGGDVYHVTSLADTSTPGTLRYGITSATGPRTIVFDISGMITLTSTLSVNKANITIAGQTAPGLGICVKNREFRAAANNLIIRHIRSRLGGDAGQPAADAIGVTSGANVILDHVTASWALDECLSVTDTASSTTIQYAIISQGLNIASHSFGSLFKPDVNSNLSVHHCLYADNRSRNPRPGYYNNSTLTFDFRNNVVYNWLVRAGYDEDDGSGQVNMNYLGNYCIAGSTSSNRSTIFNSGSSGTETQIYFSGDKIDSNFNGVLDGVNATAANYTGTYGLMGGSFSVAPVYTQTADEALETVLAQAGAFPWNRDTLDANVVAQVRSYGTAGKIINTIDQAGGWPTYPVETRAAGFDTDNDGMPDYWETARGLNPSVANHNADYDADGYTDLEEYLVWLAPIPAPKPVVWTGGTAGRYELITNWDIPWQPSALDRAEINSGKATVGYIGQEAGTLTVANTASSNAELAVTAGSLAITNRLILGNATGAKGTASLTGGSLTAGGAIVLASAASSTGELKVAKSAYVQVGGLTINTGSGRSSKVGLEVASDGCSLIYTTAASTLGGGMDVQSLSDFRPREGDKFLVIASTDPNGVHFTGNFSTFTSNITLGLPGPSAFGGAASGANYELTFLGYTYGDASGDHKVDGSDLALMGGAWLQSSQGWGTCDFTGEGMVDGSDLALMGGNWMWSLPGGAPALPIPEPATVVLLAPAAVILRRRRRR